MHVTRWVIKTQVVAISVKSKITYDLQTNKQTNNHDLQTNKPTIMLINQAEILGVTLKLKLKLY